MAVQSFTDLQQLFAPKLAIGAPGSTGSTGSGGYGGTNVTINVPPGSTGSTGATGGTGSGAGAAASPCASWWNYITNPVTCLTQNATQALGSQLLRLALFLIGLICIIGAIYLYKGNNQILAVPTKLVKGATKAVTKAAAEAAKGAEEA